MTEQLQIDRNAIRARLEVVIDALSRSLGVEVPYSEVEDALAEDNNNLIEFCIRYGQDIDWIVRGDLRGMVVRGAVEAGWQRR